MAMAFPLLTRGTTLLCTKASARETDSSRIQPPGDFELWYGTSSRLASFPAKDALASANESCQISSARYEITLASFPCHQAKPPCHAYCGSRNRNGSEPRLNFCLRFASKAPRN